MSDGTVSVDQILRDHGLTRETAKQFVARSTAFNRQEIANDADLSIDTVHRYKRAFREMDTVTRLRVMSVLVNDLHNELADAHLFEDSERS